MMDKLLALLKSRKFWAAIVGLVVVTASKLDPNFPISAEQLSSIVYLLVAYILGTGLEDSRLAARK
jgi:hypothetical protein